MLAGQITPLHLPDELFLGQGVHKVVYIDPRDSRRCIKVPFALPDSDLRKELRYRKAIKRRGRTLEMLAAYYGTVETDKGTGFVFERVVDFDGSPSMGLGEYLRRNCHGGLEGGPQPSSVLVRLKQLMADESIIIARHSGYDNMLIQRRSPKADDFTVRVIDDIGSNAKVPFLFYFDCIGRIHAKKFWKLLLERMQSDFPEIVTASFIRKNHLDSF